VPAGVASIEFNTPNQTKRAARLLANATLSSIPLRVTGFEHGVHPKFFRGQRVDEGYVNEALKAKAPATVVVFGFPAKWGLRETRSFLHAYRLDTWGEPVEAFQRIFACVFTGRLIPLLTTAAVKAPLLAGRSICRIWRMLTDWCGICT
jgi:hypothetical protein